MGVEQIVSEYIKINDTLIYNYQKDIIDEKDKEIERLKELCDKYEEEHSNEFQCWKRDRKELLDKRARIDKAIDRISLIRMDRDTSIETHKALDEILNILKGSDK